MVEIVNAPAPFYRIRRSGDPSYTNLHEDNLLTVLTSEILDLKKNLAELSMMKRRKMWMDHIHQHQEDSKEIGEIVDEEEDGIRTDTLMFNSITVVNMGTL